MDRTSNMLSSLKNAAMAKRKFIEIPLSKEIEAVAKVLKESGFLQDIKVFKPEGEKNKMLRLTLMQTNNIFAISEVKRVSKPGHRVYKKAFELKQVAGGYGVLVVSTSRGIMSGNEARKKRLGGEVICFVY